MTSPNTKPCIDHIGVTGEIEQTLEGRTLEIIGNVMGVMIADDTGERSGNWTDRYMLQKAVEIALQYERGEISGKYEGDL